MWTRTRLLALLRGRAVRVTRPADEQAVTGPQEKAVRGGYETAVKNAPERAERRG